MFLEKVFVALVEGKLSISGRLHAQFRHHF